MRATCCSCDAARYSPTATRYWLSDDLATPRLSSPRIRSRVSPEIGTLSAHVGYSRHAMGTHRASHRDIWDTGFPLARERQRGRGGDGGAAPAEQSGITY